MRSYIAELQCKGFQCRTLIIWPIVWLQLQCSAQRLQIAVAVQGVWVSNPRGREMVSFHRFLYFLFLLSLKWTCFVVQVPDTLIKLFLISLQYRYSILIMSLLMSTYGNQLFGFQRSTTVIGTITEWVSIQDEQQHIEEILFWIVIDTLGQIKATCLLLWKSCQHWFLFDICSHHILNELQVRYHSDEHLYTLMLHGGSVKWGRNYSSEWC